MTKEIRFQIEIGEYNGSMELCEMKQGGTQAQ